MFDLDEIKQRTTNKSYQLGVSLYHAGKVSQLSLTKDKATAIVSGQYDYKVSLINTEHKTEAKQGETLQASCDCPAADYQDICKHAIALALRVESSAKEQLGEISDNETALQISAQAQLKSWFKQKSSEQLTDIIMAYIADSEHEFDKWQLAMLNEDHALNATELGKLITKALPKKQVWEWNEVRGYFSDAQEMFEVIFPAIEKCTIEKQWQLILKALQRLNKVLEQIDDSGGFRFDIEGLLNEKLTTLFNQQLWSDEKKAQWIFEHFQVFKYDIFPAVPDDFELQAGVNKRFLNLCKTEAEKRVQAGLDLSNWDNKWTFKHLTQPLIEQAEQAQDWQEQCRLMTMSAFDHADYLKMGDVCLQHNEPLESEHYLQQAYQRANTPDEKKQCNEYEIKVRVALTEYKGAWQLAWQLFTNNPSFMAYKNLQKLQQQTGVIDSDFMEKTEQILANCYVETTRGIANNADALLDFYLDKNELEKARLWALAHKANAVSLLKLANLIIAFAQQDAVDLYYRVLGTIIEQTNNKAYQQATDLLIKLEKILTANGADAVILYAMIDKIIQQYKQKRNMMKLLKTHFAYCFK
ncbi:SWIM zinc finger family protein [Psychromonas hadalis]|uniref:SWIM zinc finger family protein n=1 Tax=Psychromonas hadalis TaxID=211669 RepID=UPI0003B7381F|nr:SWIM zinc finger family protein [Psychromonas hadalis]